MQRASSHAPIVQAARGTHNQACDSQMVGLLVQARLMKAIELADCVATQSGRRRRVACLYIYTCPHWPFRQALVLVVPRDLSLDESRFWPNRVQHGTTCGLAIAPADHLLRTTTLLALRTCTTPGPARAAWLSAEPYLCAGSTRAALIGGPWVAKPCHASCVALSAYGARVNMRTSARTPAITSKLAHMTRTFQLQLQAQQH